jgi:predicted porin
MHQSSKKLFFLLSCGVCNLASAQADSSQPITLYGRLDTSIDSVHISSAGGKPATSAVYLSPGTSWWGVRGREDLGGGLNAYFKLESGFYVDTGAAASATTLFNRESFVGIGGGFGSLQLGSQWTPALLITQTVDPFQRTSSGAILNIMQQNAGNKNRGYFATQNNAIHYRTPDFNGVSARVFYGLGENTTAPTAVGDFGSVSLEYKKGPAYVGFSAENEKVASVPAGVAWSNKTYTLGGVYDFGVVKLHAYLLKNKLDANRDVNAYMAGFVYPIGNGQIRGAYTNTKVADTPGTNANLFSIGYTYDMSKRTTLFTTYSRLNNGALSDFGLLNDTRTSGLPANGQGTNSFEVGIRTNF